MIHFNRPQYQALKAFASLVKKEIKKNGYVRRIPSNLTLIGQEYGFCNDEIIEIVEYCHDDVFQMATR